MGRSVCDVITATWRPRRDSCAVKTGHSFFSVLGKLGQNLKLDRIKYIEILTYVNLEVLFIEDW